MASVVDTVNATLENKVARTKERQLWTVVRLGSRHDQNVTALTSHELVGQVYVRMPAIKRQLCIGASRTVQKCPARSSGLSARSTHAGARMDWQFSQAVNVRPA